MVELLKGSTAQMTGLRDGLSPGKLKWKIKICHGFNEKQSAELSVEVGSWELYCEIEHVRHNMAIALSYCLWKNATAQSMN